jgi:hypothetical protein
MVVNVRSVFMTIGDLGHRHIMVGFHLGLQQVMGDIYKQLVVNVPPNCVSQKPKYGGAQGPCVSLN